MSLERTALRLGVVMALSNAMQAPFPTIGQNRVFDSRIDPIQGATPGDIAPIAIVITDDDDRAGLSGNNGGPPWRQHVTLVIELSMGLVGPLEDADGKPLTDETGAALTTFLPVETEPELELMLDLFESQVEHIFRQPPNAWAHRLFADPPAGSIVRIESWNSKRFVEREAQYRFAARQIVLKVLLPQPPEPDIIAHVGNPPAPPSIPAPLGPLIDAVIEDEGPYAASCEAMRDLLTEHGGFQPTILPPLTRVRIVEADAGGGNRPDGVAEAKIPTP